MFPRHFAIIAAIFSSSIIELYPNGQKICTSQMHQQQPTGKMQRVVLFSREALASGWMCLAFWGGIPEIS